MRQILMIAAAMAMLGGFGTSASAQKIDKNGRCHDSAGKFAKAEVCNGTSSAKAATAPALDPKGPYKLDAKGKCHDAKGKMATKARCAA